MKTGLSGAGGILRDRSKGLCALLNKSLNINCFLLMSVHFSHFENRPVASCVCVLLELVKGVLQS